MLDYLLFKNISRTCEKMFFLRITNEADLLVGGPRLVRRDGRRHRVLAVGDHGHVLGSARHGPRAGQRS